MMIYTAMCISSVCFSCHYFFNGSQWANNLIISCSTKLASYYLITTVNYNKWKPPTNPNEMNIIQTNTKKLVITFPNLVKLYLTIQYVEDITLPSLMRNKKMQYHTIMISLVVKILAIYGTCRRCIAKILSSDIYIYKI